MKANNQTIPNEQNLKLKSAAERYKCKVPSLRAAIKSGKLAAESYGPKSTYYLKPEDIERFLKESPGIASIFHPKNAAPEDQGAKQTLPSNETSGQIPEPRPIAKPEPTARDRESSVPAANKDASKETPENPAGRRRNRRRGRGGRGGNVPTAPALREKNIRKSLDGMTDQERLRIVAFLNELTAIVASA